MPPAGHWPSHGDHYRTYMAALLEGDIRGLRAVIDSLLARDVPWPRICHDFLQRGLYDVGRMWECNQIPVAVEHLAASATHVVLSDRFMRHQRRNLHASEVIVACVPNEFHDIGTLVVANACEEAGCKAVLLGSNTPTRELLKFIRQRHRFPDLLALSITLPANRIALHEGLATITAEFPGLPIIVGGQALDGHAEAATFREALQARFPTVRHVPTLEALGQVLNALPSLEYA